MMFRSERNELIAVLASLLAVLTAIFYYARQCK